MIHVEVSNRQSALDVDTSQLRDAVAEVLRTEGLRHAEVSLAVIGDAEIHELNRRFLQHDYPTDVLSFVLERSDDSLDGEVIISTETAMSRCGDYGWSAANELTLYAIHGTLHLVGFDDKAPLDREQMREREKFHLTNLGIVLPRPTTASLQPNGLAEGDEPT